MSNETHEMGEQPREIEPPWAKYPGYPPGDTFWRQTGEAWLTWVWRPYWDSLDAAHKSAYLERWRVPEVWSRYYFDEDFAQWLESVDEP